MLLWTSLIPQHCVFICFGDEATSNRRSSPDYLMSGIKDGNHRAKRLVDKLVLYTVGKPVGVSHHVVCLKVSSYNLPETGLITR